MPANVECVMKNQLIFIFITLYHPFTLDLALDLDLENVENNLGKRLKYVVTDLELQKS